MAATKAMRFYHNIWTKPALNGRWGIEEQLIRDLWLYALSLHYVKKFGHTIVLHADQLSEQIYSVLPYDAIYRSLDDMAVDDIFWAAGKVEALKQEPLGSVHIDGDVFLKSLWPFEKIASDCDLVVQGDTLTHGSIESWFRPQLWPYAYECFPQLFQHQQDICYNCGLMRFNNAALKDQFIGLYQELTAHLSLSKRFIELVKDNPGMDIDVLVEQTLLRILAERQYKVKKLLRRQKMSEHFISVDGYQHLMGMSKYMQLPMIHDELKKENPRLYDIVVKLSPVVEPHWQMRQISNDTLRIEMV